MAVDSIGLLCADDDSLLFTRVEKTFAIDNTCTHQPVVRVLSSELVINARLSENPWQPTQETVMSSDIEDSRTSSLAIVAVVITNSSSISFPVNKTNIC